MIDVDYLPDTFVQRCMRDSTMQAEYPDLRQRLAVCVSIVEGEDEQIDTTEQHNISTWRLRT
jgi:hypothetical protein